MSRNRVDGAVRLEEEIEHPATRGMANCPKDIRLAIGSHHHVVSICKQTLTRQVRSRPLSSCTRGSIKYPRIPAFQLSTPVRKSSIPVLSPRLFFERGPSANRSKGGFLVFPAFLRVEAG